MLIFCICLHVLMNQHAHCLLGNLGFLASCANQKTRVLRTKFRSILLLSNLAFLYPFSQPICATLSLRTSRASLFRRLNSFCQTKRFMRSWVEIVGTDTFDTTPSLVIHANSGRKFMFNCGEGTQRLCSEKCVRLGKLTDIFLTRICWDTVGGLPGMLLTLADTGLKDVLE